MKTAIAVIITFLLTAYYSCKEKADYETEKAAIMAVIEEETAAYYASDFERWSSTYLNDSKLISITSSMFGYEIAQGWDELSARSRPYITGEKLKFREVKTPLIVKIYGECAYVVFENKLYDNRNEINDASLVTNLLEKHDGKWKMVYRNANWTHYYSQAEPVLLTALNYAKANGKGLEHFASSAGDLFKTGWDKRGGFSACSEGIMSYWRNDVPMGDFKVIEQDDRHVVFTADNMFSALKKAAQFEVTYEDYLIFYRIVFERIAEYLDCTYDQQATENGVKITITAKQAG